jgi:hypothetical protein
MLDLILKRKKGSEKMKKIGEKENEKNKTTYAA